MLDIFENWIETNSNYWNENGIMIDEICHSPSDYLVQSICVKQSTSNAFGQIIAWEGHIVYIMDFEALNFNDDHFYRHYEFTDIYDFNKWQIDYISFMCG